MVRRSRGRDCMRQVVCATLGTMCRKPTRRRICRWPRCRRDWVGLLACCTPIAQPTAGFGPRFPVRSVGSVLEMPRYQPVGRLTGAPATVATRLGRRRPTSAPLNDTVIRVTVGPPISIAHDVALARKQHQRPPTNCPCDVTSSIRVRTASGATLARLPICVPPCSSGWNLTVEVIVPSDTEEEARASLQEFDLER